MGARERWDRYQEIPTVIIHKMINIRWSRGEGGCSVGKVRLSRYPLPINPPHSSRYGVYIDYYISASLLFPTFQGFWCPVQLPAIPNIHHLSSEKKSQNLVSASQGSWIINITNLYICGRFPLRRCIPLEG